LSVEDELFAPQRPGELRVLEAFPGWGKTHSVLSRLLEESLRARVLAAVFLPTHSSMLAAFRYIASKYADTARALGRRRLPVLIYYEGAENFCPLARDTAKWRAALDYMRRAGAVPEGLYSLARGLEPREAFKALGASFICRNLCPVYASTRAPRPRGDPTRVVPPASQPQDEVLAAALSQLGSAVRQMRPDVASDGSPLGECPRAYFMKSSSVAFRGAIVIAPHGALGFVLRTLEAKADVASRSKRRRPPRLAAVLDEYDRYLLTPERFRLYSLADIEAEASEAWAVASEEARHYPSSHDPSRLFPAIAAYAVLSHALASARAVLSGAAQVDRESFPASAALVADVALSPLPGAPPLAPRTVEPDLDIGAAVSSAASSLGVDPGEARAYGYSRALRVWSALWAAGGRAYRAPALVRRYGEVYGAEYVGLGQASSAAASIASLARAGRAVLLYSASPARVGGRAVLLVHAATYDRRFSALVRAGAVLISASGLAFWSSIASLRSGGLASVSLPQSAEVAEERPGQHYAVAVLRDASTGLSIRLVVPQPGLLGELRRLVRVVPHPELPFLTPGQADLSKYIELVRAAAASASDRQGELGGLVPAVVVFCQNRSVARAVASALGAVECSQAGCGQGQGGRPLYWLARLGRAEAYIAYARSRFSRGVDLPQHAYPLHVVFVGTTLRPPSTFDLYTQYTGAGTRLAFRVYVGGQSPERAVALAHTNLDVLEAVNELSQAVGRALRRAYSRAAETGSPVRCDVHVTSKFLPRVEEFAPAWLRALL